MPEPSAFEAAIAQLEAQRSVLGDAAVDAAIAGLRAHAEPAPASSPEGGSAVHPGDPRLRQVSILFVDVVGSTAMLQHADAEDAHALLIRALERFASIVREENGEVLRFTGDGLLAAFGSLGSREDEAEHAVRAGLRIQDAAALHARQVTQDYGASDFGVRAGIHTGPVLLGGGVEADRNAIGHAVHLAARMEQSAPVGRLRISQATWSLVRGLFDVEAQPPLLVKGHDEPLVTYLVRGARADPEHSMQRGIEGIATPMIGRDADLERLLAVYEQVARTRRPASALVLGEAGVGKSRRRRALAGRLALGTAGTPSPGGHSLQARAHPSSALQPFGLLRQLFARWLRITDDLDAAVARDRFVTGLAPWLQSTAGVGPELRAQLAGQLLGLDFSASPQLQATDAQTLREQGSAALREAILALAARAPLLVVLDDLHWADEASLQVVQALAAGEADDVPLTLLLLARPSLVEQRPWPLPPEGVEFTQLELQPLTSAADEMLADALLAPIEKPPAALRANLVTRAAGNPYFMEELLRMWIDDGVIDTGARPWRVNVDRLAALRVPETLFGVMQARLDTLPTGELAALQHASIVGSVFWSSALAALDPGAPAALPALARKGLIVSRGAGAFANTDEHAFQHQLLHDVTYATVLKKARREGHARAARWLAERVAGREGEFLAITAEHYERGGDSAMALEYYARARTDASARFAHAEVLRLIERILDQPALTSPRRRFVQLEARYDALANLGRDAEAQATRQQLHDLAEAQDDDALRADVVLKAMFEADREGRPEDASRWAERAIELASRSEAPAAAVALTLAHAELAWVAFLRRDFATAQRRIAIAIEHARRAAEIPPEDGGYDAYEIQLRSIEIQMRLAQERPADAAHAARQALRTLAERPRPLPRSRFHLLITLSEAERDLGALVAAADTAREALEQAAAIGMPRLQAIAQRVAAESALLRQDPEAATAAAEEAVRLARETNFRSELSGALRMRGEAALARGDLEAARRDLDAALALSVEQNLPNDARALRVARAVLDQQTGRGDEARRAVTSVLDEAAADPGGNAVRLSARSLWGCLRVLEASRDPRAAAVLADLRDRLAELLRQLDSRADRQRLVAALPHWAAVAARVPPAELGLSAAAEPNA